MESPPKRMTRSRAAAKATEPAINSTRIITAAARARSTATASTKSTAAKRKTRADENEEDEELLHKSTSAIKRPTRGRPRKIAEHEESSSTAAAPTITARPTRGRPPKKAAEVPKEDPAPAPRAVRGRPRKVVEAEAEVAAPEPATRSTRTRGATSTTVSAAAKATTAGRTVAKKAVKFQEPDKENIEPVVKKAPVVTGIRGRPAKRGPAAAPPRRPQVAEKEKKPLSPKKVTQLSMATRDEESEDELAGGDYAPIPLMKKNPVKPPTVAPVSVKQTELSPVEPDADSTMQVNFDILNPPALTSNIASPARRPPAVVSPFKDTMKSPARRVAITFPGSALKSARSHGATEQGSPFKGTLLQSAVKRPPSPIKGLQPVSAFNPHGTTSPAKVSILQSPAKRGMPGFRPLIDLPQREQLTGLGSPVAKSQTPSAPLSAKKPSEKLLMDEELLDDDEVDGLVEIDTIKFPGRLSAVFPREADPSFVEEDDEEEEQHDQVIDTNDCLLEEAQPELCEAEEEQVGSGDETENENEEENEENEVEEQQPAVSSPLSSPGIHDSINVAVPDEEEEASSSTPSTPTASSPCATKNPMYQLRPTDLDPCDATDSESEDDATMHTQATPTTASLFAAKSSRRSTLGFTSLAEQFGAWSAASPTKPTPSASREARVESPNLGSGEVSPAVENFFENEMLAQPEVPSISMENGGEETPFDDVMILDEDLELAQEANDMSLMEPGQLLKPESQSFDDSLSDASQEYGDENQLPIDPAIAATTTPVRPLMKTFHTTTKVPLKPADESTPSPVKKRSLSASRVTLKRPSVGLTRNATVISYSPTKDRRSSRAASQAADRSTMPETPSKSDIWSSMGTPARTPRKDVDPGLLRGAVVHVDVHTSEGADASGIFVELLTQMGARCVKTWHWNPNSLSGEEVSSSKVGITHVVYKDGGKRTLEKVRQTNGVVQCVGVSWVLDCERENEWLEESPYYIDTSLVPRGGARRRKSMEPRALANQNGTLVGNGSKSNTSSRQSMGPPATPANRRQSTVWMHSPSEGVEDQEEEEDDIEWSKFILTPVPKTPAPEAVAKYAAEIPQTPGADDTEEMDLSPTKQDLLTRTCPPKKSGLFQDLGHGILNKDKDEQVLLRLMAARRKSLQFAPKIGSPLSKAWA